LQKENTSIEINMREKYHKNDRSFYLIEPVLKPELIE
jgi:hypothetical protein